VFHRGRARTRRGQDYHGREAVRAWKQEAQAKYNYTLEVLGSSEHGANVTLTVRLTGTFPGSPVELEYVFELANGKIASLTID
jgi:hypothetical protein